ncbi:MAG TPA: efflux RND transporter permease subunit [Gemmataceae bacterium]|nr:efflux RND transporter permease subunit [Gemmataceae bacterium]
MWLVNAALRRPYSVWVGMLLVLVLGIVSYQRTPTDILPNLKVPVVVVFASYRGMPAPDMEQSVTSILERALTHCDHLEHIESRSLLGIGIIQVYFRSEVDPDIAASQVVSLVNGEMQNLPPGMLPPSILKYDASAIPVGNLIISSNSRDDKYLLDLADHELRDELAGIEGLASAPVFGGVFRQVQIYVHPRTLEALKLSPMDVARIVNNQSQVIPTGEMRIGSQTYYVSSNSMLSTPKDFEKIPLWTEGRKVVYLGDVAEVVDGTRWRTNTVCVDGRRAVYMPLLRQAGASAIHVVDRVNAFLPELYGRGTIPEDVHIEVAFDQSQVVRDALTNLRLEAVVGAVLASLVVLLFLGSLRSTWIVAFSIPLSVLAAFVGLYFTGHTLNIMTLGGLALVLGRILDDSIVDVENTVRHLHMDKTPFQAALDSANEIAVPVFMATLTTVVVFFPITFMEGIGKYLFTPLAVSAAMAMFASYFVSRTVSPVCCARFLRPHDQTERFPWRFFTWVLILALFGLAVFFVTHWIEPLLQDRKLPFGGRFLRGFTQGALLVGIGSGILIVLAPVIGLLFWMAPRFDRLYEHCAAAYEAGLRLCLRWRLVVIAGLIAIVVPAIWGFGHVGQELFPEVDAGEFTVHLRATGGPRVEETERQVAEMEEIIRAEVSKDDLALTLANIGISSRWSAIYTPNNGPHAAFIRVQLRSGFAGRRTPALAYVERLRQRLADRFPGHDFFFETGGMIRSILNSGAVAPIEVQVYGRNAEDRRRVTRHLDQLIGRFPQVLDTYLPQAMDLPQLRVEVDRTRAALLGFSESDVIRNVISTLMSSAQIAPNFWIDPQSGNPYFIGVQYPEYLVENIQTLENIPISSERAARSMAATTAGARSPTVRLLKDVARIERSQGPIEVHHRNASRINQLFVSVSGNDLARIAGEIERLVDQPPLEYAMTNLPNDRTHLAENADFRKDFESYLKRSKKTLRTEIQKKYGVDAERLKLPQGVRVQVRGEVSSMRQSFADMGFSLLLAVVLVYLVMAAQFGSWLDPLIMIVAAPLGLIGVIGMLWATGTSLNIQSCMGILMMVGISVSNSVLVVEFANQQRADGLEIGAAIVRAARIRLRPILMTTVATILGLLPMALHLRPGDEMNVPLARAVVGGLAGSTLLTLFVVPVLYTLFKRPESVVRNP